MTIYDELKKDHRTVLSLLDRLIAEPQAVGDPRGAIVQELRDELIPHARAEEAILYNALRDAGEAKGKVAHAYVEHVEAETLLRALQAADAADLTWVAAAKKLRESLAHHIAEEEGEVFAAARRVFSDEEAAQMGEAFRQMKPQVREEGFMGTTLDMIANLLPARLRASVRKGAASRAA
ncbi:MAG TPA: hemerythrin domain-containing protein [Polyangiaceae bacterium]|nr:hemerythrin domain-containing protein [Polyangiaceae bacterium]